MAWAQGGLVPACKGVQGIDILVFSFAHMVTIWYKGHIEKDQFFGIDPLQRKLKGNMIESQEKI